MIALVSRPDPITFTARCGHCARQIRFTSEDPTPIIEHDASHPTCGVCRRTRIAEPARTGSRCDDCWRASYDDPTRYAPELTDADWPGDAA